MPRNIIGKVMTYLMDVFGGLRWTEGYWTNAYNDISNFYKKYGKG